MSGKIVPAIQMHLEERHGKAAQRCLIFSAVGNHHVITLRHFQVNLFATNAVEQQLRVLLDRCDLILCCGDY